MVNSNNRYVAVAEEIFPYNEDDELQDLSKQFNDYKEQIVKMVRNLCHTVRLYFLQITHGIISSSV